MKSLLGNNLYRDANANMGRAELAAPTAKAKDEALKQLIASVPEEDRRGARTDRTHVLEATKVLNKYNVHYDGKGGWLLKGMVSSLRPYQVLGAAFMKERETGSEQPLGGLHADEMGFGKTVMMIAAMIANPPRPGDTRKTTLIVATPALVAQWMGEIQLHTKDNVLGAVVRYHTGSRIQGTGALMFLQTADIILTTYTEVLRSYPKYDPPKELVSQDAKMAWWRTEYEDKRGILHRCNFHRVVLDEAQIIKNHKSQTSVACRGLMAKHRWAISGTPIHNTVEELFPYFKFLRVKHTGTYKVFKENFCEKGSEVANERLHSFLRKFMIRRTHADSLFGAPLVQLPENHQQTIPVDFNEVERAIYDTVRARYIRKIHSYRQKGLLKHKYNNILTMLLRLRQLTAHIFLLQEVIEDIFELEDVEKLWDLTRAETNPDNPNKDIVVQMKKLIMAKGKEHQDDEADSTETPVPENINDLDENGEPRGIIFKFRKYLRNLKETSKWGDLKDRSLCHRCHDRPDDPYVTSCMHIFCKECLEAVAFEAAEKGEDRTSCIECGTIYTATKQCEGLRELGWEDNSNFSCQGEDGPVRTSRKNPEEDMKWINFEGHVLPSAKTAALAAQVDLWLKESPDGKIIVFTQFTLMIKILGRICNQRNWGYCTYHGKMTLPGREKAIRDFKSQRDKRILLASLKCGGVGLNLTMASRVICIDLWWNSSVEQQAFCRIFRIGQTEKTYITRFVVKNTVDEKLDLMQQEKSRIITHAMGDDGKRPGKLSLKELVRLFGPLGEGDEDIKEFIIVDDDDEFEGDVPPIVIDEDDDNSVGHAPRL
ncbi:MAG: hypothetical protein M1835_005663 [Candelina submexicana]|nr:MAG: hypothetical protein M1835_005663 [Candelina submexicana]